MKEILDPPSISFNCIDCALYRRDNRKSRDKYLLDEPFRFPIEIDLYSIFVMPFPVRIINNNIFPQHFILLILTSMIRMSDLQKNSCTRFNYILRLFSIMHNIRYAFIPKNPSSEKSINDQEFNQRI